jgi:superfamily II DNA or RNA helicase
MNAGERRFFNDSERVALFLAADGRCECQGCEACGPGPCNRELEPGWHADHVHPHSRHGKTDVVNGQALCPPCNRKKGANVTALRAWQDAALARFVRTEGDFLAVACPGAGKTTFALEAARRLIEMGAVQRIIVVVPTSHLRKQWATAASRTGIQLDYKFANGAAALARDFDGLAVTYAAVASEPALYRRLAADRSLVILDEVHHGGDEFSWGRALRMAFEPAVRRLLLSGTPTRTDRSPVPFVRYDENGMFDAECGYTYDYGTAIRDHAVRPIEFLALDGSVRWREAGAIVSTDLADTDERTLISALSVALSPDGEWMTSVFRRANEELTRHRAEVPDAAGLVVAPGQVEARRYAAILEGITGEDPYLVITDEPDASNRIAAFSREGNSARWIVAVQMVSEGVDIPRLAVGVYASRIRTGMFFRQVVGRFVRMRSPEDEATATLLVPSVEPLLGYAREIEKTVSIALREEQARVERDMQKQRDTQLPLFDERPEPVSSSEAVHHSTILSGETFADEELRRAANFRQAAEMPASVTDSQVARLLRLAGAAGVSATVTLRADNAVTPPNLSDEKATLKRLIQRKVGQLSRRTDKPHSHIHGELNQIHGDTTATATADTLEARLATLDKWLHQARP